jgi:MFS family permease
VGVGSRRKTATIGILVGLLLSALDGTLVATALPQILDDLNGFRLYFLPNASFMLCQTVSIPIWGRLSDLYGRGRFHLLAILVLVAGSVFCGLSRSMDGLVASRALQGLGAGGLMSLSFIMIGDLFELEERARMQGAISSVWGIASLAGPLLGGWIAQTWSWRGIFWLNLPVAAVSAALVQASWERRVPETRGRPDWIGAGLLALASASALAGFGLAGKLGWTEPSTLKCLGAAVFFAAILIRFERRARDPFLALDLYRDRLFLTGALTGVCAMTCLFVAIMHVPLLVVGVLGRPLQTGGLMLTCMMIPWMACSAATKPLLARLSYRTLAAAGMALAGAAYLVLLRSGSLACVIGAMALLGTGLGVTVAPLLIAAQNSVGKERLGAATSVTQFTRSMGSAVGLAVMGSLLVAAFGGREPEGLVRFRSQLDAAALASLVEPLARGLRVVFTAGAVAAGLGLALALLIPPGRAAELKKS